MRAETLKGTFSERHIFPPALSHCAAYILAHRFPRYQCSGSSSILLITYKKTFATGNRLIMVFSEERRVVSPNGCLKDYTEHYVRAIRWDSNCATISIVAWGKHDFNITLSVTKVIIKTLKTCVLERFHLFYLNPVFKTTGVFLAYIPTCTGNILRQWGFFFTTWIE